MTLNRKKQILGDIMSHERTFRGHLKKSRAKSPFFVRDRENPASYTKFEENWYKKATWRYY